MLDRVLLVEDDERVARLLTRLLRAGGLDTVHVATKRAAMRAVQSRASWSAFVVDLRLGGPDCDGLDILERIAASYPFKPRVIVSGVLDRAVINRAARHGATFICKPFSADDLQRFAFAALSSSIDDVELRMHVVEWGLVARLTSKQQEVLALAAAGLSREASRVAANVTESTYSSHVAAILARAARRDAPCNDLQGLVIQLLRAARVRPHVE
jgi:FixJ family two-component response regulator